MSETNKQGRLNSALVVGGGIAGIKAALDLAEAGRRVYIADKSPALGGFLPLLDRQFPTNDCQICFLAPEFGQAGRGLDIAALPLTRLTKLEGEAGGFQANLTTEPRYIDTSLCVACGACVEACPEGAVDFTPGLHHASPTCMRYPQATPEAFSIDMDKCTQCGKCLEVCEPDAIKLDMEPTQQVLEVGSVVTATGAELFDPSGLAHLWGYGVFPDVVTSLEFERIMSATGPTKGEFARPSDGKKPTRIGWVQCVGSRTTREPGNPYCSTICCMFAMKEAVWAKEHFAEDLEATIFFMDMRPMGKDYEQYYNDVRDNHDVNFVRCRPHTITWDDETKELLLNHVTEEGEAAEARLDMLVLATGFCAPGDAEEQARALGVELSQYRFVQCDDLSPVSTSRPGVYACGMSTGPKDIPDSIMQASAAACLAGSHLEQGEGLQPEAAYPPERDVSGEEIKVGVFFADFGSRVRYAMDLAKVISDTKALPGVTVAEEVDVAAGPEGTDKLVERIKASGVNRVVVAGYSPRTHGRLFRDVVRRAGLNRAYLEMANIRDQDALVTKDSAAATDKAFKLVKMALAEVKFARPIYMHTQPLNHDVLVVGGGVAGLTAALSLAEAGRKVYVVERAKELGGLGRRVQRTLHGDAVQPYMAELVDKVKATDNIQVITDALVVDHEGTVGNFTTGVQSGPSMYYQAIEHGVAIIATGARAYEPNEYLYGQNDKVMTQLELEERLADGGEEGLNTVVMIQCVGSRNEQNPACGRICCRTAVNNALWLKDLRPEARVIVLYRDMRTPFDSEDNYRKAREEGVLFARFTQEEPPQVAQNGDGLTVTFNDMVLGRPIQVQADALVLSTPQVAADEDTEELCEIFRLQQSEGGFLLEKHVKVVPVDTPAPGIFAAGSVLAPKSVDEAITQGLAAAGRAQTVLAQASVIVAGGVAKVEGDKCAACLVCVRACPVGVPFINAEGYSQIDPEKCQGCGICAAECPAKAIQLQGFNDDQIMAATDALLEGVL